MSDLNLSSVSGKAVQAATFSRGAYDSKTPFVPPAGFEPLEVKLVNPQSFDFAASASALTASVQPKNLAKA